MACTAGSRQLILCLVRPPPARMHKAFLLLTSIVVAACAADQPSPTGDYSRQILGRWLPQHRNKFEIFYSDGRWAVQRHETAEPDSGGGRHWYIRGNTLVYTFQGREYTETIVSISRTQMVTSLFQAISSSEIESHDHAKA